MESKSKLTFSKVVERFSYGCGDFGCNIIYTAMSAFLLFYYTDYAKVSALAVGNHHDGVENFRWYQRYYHGCDRGSYKIKIR